MQEIWEKRMQEIWEKIYLDDINHNSTFLERVCTHKEFEKLVSRTKLKYGLFCDVLVSSELEGNQDKIYNGKIVSYKNIIIRSKFKLPIYKIYSDKQYIVEKEPPFDNPENFKDFHLEYPPLEIKINKGRY
ncbi:MAG: hypothetical protein ACFFG0_03510 [Candidatus Thorarchaeota archaeon]